VRQSNVMEHAGQRMRLRPLVDVVARAPHGLLSVFSVDTGGAPLHRVGYVDFLPYFFVYPSATCGLRFDGSAASMTFAPALVLTVLGDIDQLIIQNLLRKSIARAYCLWKSSRLA
jgi:hypothetical protein